MASRGQREVEGRAVPIEDEDLVARLRAAARRVHLKMLVLAAVLTAAVALCPA